MGEIPKGPPNKEIEKQEPSPEDKEAIKKKLLEYGKENYSEYFDTISEDIEMEALDRVNKSNAEIDLTAIPDKEKERIKSFLSGSLDEEYSEAFNRQCFDLTPFIDIDLPEEEKIIQIYTILVKDRSFPKAVEKQKEKGVKYSGMENDPDLADIQNLLPEIFTGDLLHQSLVSEVRYSPDIINVWIDGYDFYLPPEKYDAWREKMPEVQEFKMRAESLSDWNARHDITRQYISFPIYLNSFYSEDLGQWEHLMDVPDKDKRRIFKIGVISHEVAHALYYNIMDARSQEEWEDIINQSGHITEYTQKYTSGVHGKKVNYNEEFAEAVRLRATTPEFLKQKFPEVDKYLNIKFPEISSLENL